MKLTKMIFDYWRHWIQLPQDTFAFTRERGNPEDVDGLFWYDGYWATFWYMINLSWFEMNDKMTSATGETRSYYPPMDLFEE